MAEKLVPVYRGFTTDDVQRLADFLDLRGIESYVDNTQSSMYGMSQGPAAHVLYVDSHVAGYTRELVTDYVRKWHGGVARDDAEREETGYETPVPDRPSDDAPADSSQDRDRAYGPSMLGDTEPAARESPEVEDLIDVSSGEEDFDHRIVRFGADRDVAEEDNHEEEEAAGEAGPGPGQGAGPESRKRQREQEPRSAAADRNRRRGPRKER